MNAPTEPSLARVAGLRGLLSMLEQSPEPTLHTSTWEARLGANVVASLLRLGILVDRGHADWYPCGGPHGSACPRRVVPSLGVGASPFVAVCGRGDGSCVSVYLELAELQLLGVCFEAFVHRLRQAFGLSGAVDNSDAGFPETRRIGDIAGRPVFLATSAGLPGFEAWLAARGEALVMVPVGRWLPATTRDRFAAGQRTELVVLSEVLELIDGALVVAMKPSMNLRVNDVPAVSYVGQEASVCIVYDNEGRRTVTNSQYQRYVTAASDFGLFVDMTTVADGGGFRASKRTEQGSVETVTLTKHEAAAIVELATTRRALRAGDFKAVGANAVEKIVEHARRKIDVRLARYAWRTIHTLAASSREGKRWQFKAPSHLQWCVIVSNASV